MLASNIYPLRMLCCTKLITAVLYHAVARLSQHSSQSWTHLRVVGKKVFEARCISDLAVVINASSLIICAHPAHRKPDSQSDDLPAQLQDPSARPTRHLYGHPHA